MDRRYRIGEVVKNLDLGQYTLKHYERVGLVTPKVDEETGYRFYDYKDYGRLIIIRGLRRMGFSVEEIVELMQGDFRDAYDALQNCRAENERKITELQRANELIDERLQFFPPAFAATSEWSEQEVPPFFFYPHFLDDELVDAAQGIAGTDVWRDSYEMGMVAIRIPVDAFKMGNTHVIQWGFVLFKPFSDQAAPPQAIEYSVRRSLVRIVEEPRVQDQGALLFPLISEALSDMKMVLRDDVYCIVGMTRLNGTQVFTVLKILIPIA